MHRGYIKMWRKMMDNPHMHDCEYLAVWVWMLSKANHRERDELLGGKRITCHPGQFTTGRKQLAECAGVSESKVERILKTMEIEQQIEQRTTRANRLITITNWGKYQQTEQRFEQQVNNDRTHCKNDKNNNTVCAAQSQTDAPQIEMNLGVSITTAAQDDGHAVTVPVIPIAGVVVTGPKQWDIMYRLPQYGPADTYIEEAVWWYNGMPDTYKQSLINDFPFDVRSEVGNSLIWIKSNPHRRKTFPHRFVRNWLTRHAKNIEANAKYAANRY